MICFIVLIFDLDKVTIKMYTQGIFLQEYFFAKSITTPPQDINYQ